MIPPPPPPPCPLGDDTPPPVFLTVVYPPNPHSLVAFVPQLLMALRLMYVMPLAQRALYVVSRTLPLFVGFTLILVYILFFAALVGMELFADCAPDAASHGAPYRAMLKARPVWPTIRGRLRAADWPIMADAWGCPGPESATAGAAWKRRSGRSERRPGFNAGTRSARRPTSSATSAAPSSPTCRC